jgi:hypothetical protein
MKYSKLIVVVVAFCSLGDDAARLGLRPMQHGSGRLRKLQRATIHDGRAEFFERAAGRV